MASYFLNGVQYDSMAKYMQAYTQAMKKKGKVVETKTTLVPPQTIQVGIGGGGGYSPPPIDWGWLDKPQADIIKSYKHLAYGAGGFTKLKAAEPTNVIIPAVDPTPTEKLPPIDNAIVEKPKDERVELMADLSDLVALCHQNNEEPPALAVRALKYLEKLGGFYLMDSKAYNGLWEKGYVAGKEDYMYGKITESNEETEV